MELLVVLEYVQTHVYMVLAGDEHAGASESLAEELSSEFIHLRFFFKVEQASLHRVMDLSVGLKQRARGWPPDRQRCQFVGFETRCPIN